MKKFKARTGSPFKEEDAQQVGEAIESIKEREGKLNPELIVKYAKKKDNFLNKYFEWDDSVASEKWRLQQARNITSHVVEVIVIREKEVETRSFFSITNEEGNNEYVTREEAISVKSYREQLLDDMEKTMENLLVLIKIFRQQ
jgi:hypothetical protein